MQILKATQSSWKATLIRAGKSVCVRSQRSGGRMRASPGVKEGVE